MWVGSKQREPKIYTTGRGLKTATKSTKINDKLTDTTTSCRDAYSQSTTAASTGHSKSIEKKQ